MAQGKINAVFGVLSRYLIKFFDFILGILTADPISAVPVSNIPL
jgi:hypothetical protein